MWHFKTAGALPRRVKLSDGLLELGKLQLLVLRELMLHLWDAKFCYTDIGIGEALDNESVTEIWLAYDRGDESLTEHYRGVMKRSGWFGRGAPVMELTLIETDRCLRHATLPAA